MLHIFLKHRTYAHDRGKVVVRGGRDLQTGGPDVLDGGVKVIQLCRNGLLVHWATWKHERKEEMKTIIWANIKRGQKNRFIKAPQYLFCAVCCTDPWEMGLAATTRHRLQWLKTRAGFNFSVSSNVCGGKGCIFAAAPGSVWILPQSSENSWVYYWHCSEAQLLCATVLCAVWRFLLEHTVLFMFILWSLKKNNAMIKYMFQSVCSRWIMYTLPTTKCRKSQEWIFWAFLWCPLRFGYWITDIKTYLAALNMNQIHLKWIHNAKNWFGLWASAHRA